MQFIKKTLPLIICFVVGMLSISQYYVPHAVSVSYLETMSKSFLVISAFAYLLGLYSIFMPHMMKVKRKVDGWGYSVVLFFGIGIGLVTGIISHAEQFNSGGQLTSFGWMYSYMLNALQGSMFALLGFYVASSSYRAFRVKSVEAFVLFLAAVILLFGRVPLGQAIWQGLGGSKDTISSVVEWVMNTPSVAARRAIMIGIALGAIATSIKIIVGIERQYLGGKD